MVITQSYSAARTQNVLAAIESSDAPMRAGQLADLLGIERHSLSATLTRLVRRGLVTRIGHGAYATTAYIQPRLF